MSLQNVWLMAFLAAGLAADLNTDMIFWTPDKDYSTCIGSFCFNISVNWSSGSSASTLPTLNFSVRKTEFVYYPPDGQVYAYADIVNYSDLYYPDSYSSEVGVFSSPNGKTHWKYHGIVVGRGPSGDWDCGGIASPGAAVAQDGSVLVGYTAENGPGGGTKRGIGIAIAPHPLGPFTKNSKPIASTDSTGLCSSPGRCDDVIMQSTPTGEIHLYHSVKNNYKRYPGGGAIMHHVTIDSGKTWSSSTVLLECGPKVPCVETIAGKFFPRALGGRGAMVLICDGAPHYELTAFMSPNMSEGFQAAGLLQAHPPDSRGPQPPSPTPGDWAVIQVAFVPDRSGDVVGVSYSRWTSTIVPSHREYHGHMLGPFAGYTHTVFDFQLQPDFGEAGNTWI